MVYLGSFDLSSAAGSTQAPKETLRTTGLMFYTVIIFGIYFSSFHKYYLLPLGNFMFFFIGLGICSISLLYTKDKTSPDVEDAIAVGAAWMAATGVT